MDRFATACKHFALTISLRNRVYVPGSANSTTTTYHYLMTQSWSLWEMLLPGQYSQQQWILDAEIALRISKASSAFGRLCKHLWQDKDIRFCKRLPPTKQLSSVHSFTGTTYHHHIQQLEQFHLRRICNIRWQDNISNLQVLEKCDLPSIEHHVIQCQLRRTGHIVRMEDSRIPIMLLYGQLKLGYRDVGRPCKRTRIAWKEILEHVRHRHLRSPRTG